MIVDYINWIILTSLQRSMQLWILLLLTILIQSARTQGIVDFGITEQVENTSQGDLELLEVNIHAQKEKTDYLQYPQACSLWSELQEASLVPTVDQDIQQEEAQLTVLKSNIKQLLAVSEKIKTTKSLLQTLAPTLEQKVVSSLQLDSNLLLELQGLQSELEEVNQTIIRLVSDLRNLVLQELNRTKDYQFDEIRLKFQLQISQARLKYLLELKNSISPNQNDFDSKLKELFGEVKEEVVKEKDRLAKVQDILHRFSEREELKIRVSNLQSQVEGLNLMIKQKESCDEKKGELHNRENKKQFQLIYNQLKVLKSMEKTNNEYCEGVTLILLKQLKKILRVYNYSFSCSEGLNDLQNSRNIILSQLSRLQQQLQQDDYDQQTKQLKTYFQGQFQIREELEKQIRNFIITDHHLDKDAIEREIDVTKSKISLIEEQLLNPPQNDAPPLDYPRIRQMVASVEEQQLQYCKLKDEYLQKYNAYDVGLKSFEHRASVWRQSQEVYLNKLQELRKLQESFERTRGAILSELQ